MTSRPASVTSIPAPQMTRSGKATVGLLAFLGLGAIGGGASLVARPDGSIMQMPVSLLAGSPFRDFLIPGLILGGLFGLGSFAVAFMGIRRVRLAPFLAFAIGCGQMIWIVVELAVIKELSFLHPTCFGLGLAIAACAVPWGLPTLRGWQAARR